MIRTLTRANLGKENAAGRLLREAAAALLGEQAAHPTRHSLGSLHAGRDRVLEPALLLRRDEEDRLSRTD